MNSISLFSPNAANASAASRGTSSRPPGNPQEALSRLGQDLSASGVSDDQRQAILSDIEASIREDLGSGHFPPDPQAAAGKIKGILEKHGVDADQLLGDRASFGGPPGGGFGADAAYSADDPAQTLLDLLQQWTDNLTGKNKDGSARSHSDDLVTGLLGIDTQA